MGEAKGRVAVVTGASSGIGKEAAKALAAEGWHVIAHGRDAGRSAEAKAEIEAAAAHGGRVDMVRADLSLLSDTARMADDIAVLTDRVDVLLNNAGGLRDRQEITAEGNEVTFAGNHLGHFLLTGRLLPLLRKAAADGKPGDVRIINVSSRGHANCPGIDWDDLQMLNDWTTVGAYERVKLCNVLFTRALAKRLGGEGIVSHAMHPGVVASNFAAHGSPQLQAHMSASPELITASEGADTLIWLAMADEPGKANGRYYKERTDSPASPLADDEALSERLWVESEALVRKAGY
ncbi:MAG TPA: SDR family NAD(P)-dependent oxidoreductase [Novosphingobium sp.]